MKLKVNSIKKLEKFTRESPRFAAIHIQNLETQLIKAAKMLQIISNSASKAEFFDIDCDDCLNLPNNFKE